MSNLFLFMVHVLVLLVNEISRRTGFVMRGVMPPEPFVVAAGIPGLRHRQTEGKHPGTAASQGLQLAYGKEE